MLLDEDGSFYFMEMNTRIQVEHPVTEMCTGFDLIKEQIRAAAGLPLSVPDIPISCAATRSSAGSTPRTRRATSRRRRERSSTFHPPGGPGVRVDTHVYAGYRVPPFYDSLLGKLIVHASTARRRSPACAARSRRRSCSRGAHDHPLPDGGLDHPDFVAGEVDTKFLERMDGGAGRCRDEAGRILTPGELVAHRDRRRTVVVLDMLRASTTSWRR
jgi:acetyl-CoA carboxylase, biotin carboxylase subunit